MAVAQVATGAQAATIGTTHTLATPATLGKTFVLFVDVAVMVGGDVLEIYLREKTLAADPLAIVRADLLAGPQVEPVWMSVPLPSVHGCDFQIKQTAGTGRTYDFSLRTLD